MSNKMYYNNIKMRSIVLILLFNHKSKSMSNNEKQLLNIVKNKFYFILTQPSEVENVAVVLKFINLKNKDSLSKISSV